MPSILRLKIWGIIGMPFFILASTAVYAAKDS